MRIKSPWQCHTGVGIQARLQWPVRHLVGRVLGENDRVCPVRNHRHKPHVALVDVRCIGHDGIGAVANRGCSDPLTVGPSGDTSAYYFGAQPEGCVAHLGREILAWME